MKTVRPGIVMDWYDGILLFQAVDDAGNHLIASLIDHVGDHGRYLVVGVEPQDLLGLAAGRICLRTLLQASAPAERYLAVAAGPYDAPLELTPVRGVLDEAWLPEAGYRLDPDPRCVDVAAGVIRDCLNSDVALRIPMATGPETP